MNKRTIFIGDVHGCYKEMKKLIKKLKITTQDQVYLVGDLINKGPKSVKVIKYVMKQENFHSVLGNHECNFLSYYYEKKDAWSNFSKNNWDIIINAGKKHPKILEYLKNMPAYIETDDFICLHGGIYPNKEIKDHNTKELTTLRELKDGTAWYKNYTGEKKIIYGHWAIEGLNVRGNTVGLDSGCVYGGKLSAYILETGEVIQQKAKKQYINPQTNRPNKNFIQKLIKKIF